MSLKSLVKSTPGRSDAARVTIEIEGESLSFLRPRVSDLQPSRELLESVSRAVVGLRPDQVYLAYLLGTTYQPDPEEGEVVPYKLLSLIHI